MTQDETARVMFKASLKFFAKTLANAPVWDADPGLFEVWFDEFGHLSPIVFRDAMRAHMRESPFFPRLSELVIKLAKVNSERTDHILALDNNNPEQAFLAAADLPDEKTVSKAEWDTFNAFLLGKTQYPAHLPMPDPTVQTFAFRIEPTDDRMRVSKEGLRSGMRALAEELKDKGWKIDEASPATISPYVFKDERAHVEEVRYVGMIFMRGTAPMFAEWNVARGKTPGTLSNDGIERFKL